MAGDGTDGRVESGTGRFEGDADDGSDPPGGSSGIDPGAIADRIRDRAEAVERREREVALRKLSVRGEVSDRQREVLAGMTAGIVDGLLASPEAALREADEEALRAAVRVYGLDPEEFGRDADGE